MSIDQELGTTAAPVVTRHGQEHGDTGQSGGAVRVSGVSPQHTPATRIWFGQVSKEPGYRSLPHHHGEAETGGYVLRGHGRIWFGETYTIPEPMLRILDLSWERPGLTTAGLGHAMWFHRTAEEGVIDGWLLYAQEAGHVHGGRGLGYSRFFTPDGTQLATVAQEGLLRAS